MAVPALADLPVLDVGGRLPRLRARVAQAGCDGLLVTNPVNVRYLTGFSGSAGLLLVRPHDLVLTTDGRYRSQAEEQLAASGIEVDLKIGNVAEQQEAVAKAVDGIRHLGLEANHVTWARQRGLAALFDDVELVPTEGMVEQLRRRKDEGEVARIRVAAGIADQALAQVKPQMAAGVTEADLAAELEFRMRSLGGAGSSFETIVASGPNGARPHARPSFRPVGEGELVVMDFGAVYEGYRSDMTRTVCLGEPASATQRRMVEVVGASQRRGMAALMAGADAKEVDRACREVIAAAGWEDAFVHGTGHGVGLDIHEAPALAATSSDTLAAGDVVTVEPGVYLPGLGGVRIEDTLVVTEGGCQPLTGSPKDLVVP